MHHHSPRVRSTSRAVAALALTLFAISCGGTGSGGTAGSAGGTGSAGTTGTAGTTGSAGTTGAAGTTGTAGARGTAAPGGGGTTGSAGTAGAAGRGGTTGTAGAGGTSGSGGRGGAAGGAGSGVAGRGGASGTGGSGAGGAAGACAGTTYDQLILCDHPVGYWAVSKGSGTEPDLSGNNNAGTYKGSTATTSTLPNGDAVTVFNGSSQYLTIPSKASYSIPTTHNLSWEGWIRPDVLQFPNDGGSGYVDWMGKCQGYNPTCEWEARMYSTTNSENRCNRMSAYVFNTSAGLGSAADWQPTCGLIQAATWYHIVGEYTTDSQPSDCTNATAYPGSINVWINGVEWNHSSHGQTGCMSQYNVVPAATSSPVNIGTMAMDGWFPGAIGKVAIYDYLLTPAQITAHYQAMAGKAPTGSCANTCSF